MGFTKISNSDFNGKDVSGLPNVPTIGATALKARFDAPAKEVVAPKVNNLIDELEASTSASSLGANAPTGRTGNTIQAILNAISSALSTVESIAHSHTNKTDCLDYLSDNEGQLNYKGEPISGGGGDYTAGNGINISGTSISAKLDSSTMEFDASGNIKGKNNHSHANKSLLDTYNQTNTDLEDAVNKKHSHNNKTVIDGLSDSSGKLLYEGLPVGDTVEWNQIVTSGTKIATVSIDGTATDVYAPTSGGGGGATSLSGLDDVSLSTPANNQVLKFDSATSKWKNGTLATSDVNGLDTTLSDKFSASATSISSVADSDTMPVLASNVQKKISWSTIKSLLKTYFDTLYSKIGHVHPISDVTNLSSALSSKITEPSTEGTSGQVLTTDGAGGRSWQNAPQSTVDQSFNSSSTNAQSGVAISGALDSWTDEVTLASGNTATFSGLDDSLAYKPFIDDANAYVTNCAKTGSGTSVQLVYTFAGGNIQVGVTKVKLRIFR